MILHRLVHVRSCQSPRVERDKEEDTESTGETKGSGGDCHHQNKKLQDEWEHDEQPRKVCPYLLIKPRPSRSTFLA